MKYSLKMFIVPVAIFLLESIKPCPVVRYFSEAEAAYFLCKDIASEHCQKVREGFQVFNKLIIQQNLSPGRFGERVIFLQQQCLGLRAQMAEEHADTRLIQQAYTEAVQELEIFYAVVRQAIKNNGL